MTTSSQPDVLKVEELACLRECAQGHIPPPDDTRLVALVAKGMLDAGHAITPAGRHALHMDESGPVPGLDN